MIKFFFKNGMFVCILEANRVKCVLCDYCKNRRDDMRVWECVCILPHFIFSSLEFFLAEETEAAL